MADPRGKQDLHFKMADKRFLIAVASWVCDLFPCFLDQASQYGGEQTRTFRIYRVIFLYLIHASS